MLALSLLIIYYKRLSHPKFYYTTIGSATYFKLYLKYPSFGYILKPPGFLVNNNLI